MIWSPINRLLPKPKNVIPPPPVPLCEGDKGGGASSVFRDMSKNIKPAPECFNQGTLDSRLKTAGMTILIKEVFSGETLTSLRLTKGHENYETLTSLGSQRGMKILLVL